MCKENDCCLVTSRGRSHIIRSTFYSQSYKQPYAVSTTKTTSIAQKNTVATVSETISVGNICVFKFSTRVWKIGRVLSFTYYLEKYKSAQAYSKPTFSFAYSSKKTVGVMCTWYGPSQIPCFG